MNHPLRFASLRTSGPIVSALVISALIASCAHQKRYAAPNLGDEQTAILEARVPMWIVSIDGENVSSLSLHDTAFIKLLPGPHIVEVAFQQFGSRQMVDRGVLTLEQSRTYGERSLKLKMLATAGCKYVVEYKLEVDEHSKRKIWNVRIVKLESA